MTIQILCIIPLVRRVVVWLVVGMYDNRTREIKKQVYNVYKNANLSKTVAFFAVLEYRLVTVVISNVYQERFT